MPNALYQRQTEYVITLNAHDCPTCGIVYGLPSDFERRKREQHEGWCCPNGHKVWFVKSEFTILREQLAATERQLEWANADYKRAANDNMDLAKSNRALKGAKTKLLRRITNGVCPCCQRSFANVQRHMATKHPGEVVSAEAGTAGG
jgi:hypothetical protein